MATPTFTHNSLVAYARAKARVMTHNKAIRRDKRSQHLIIGLGSGIAVSFSYVAFTFGLAMNPLLYVGLGASAISLRVLYNTLERRTYALDSKFPALVGYELPMPSVGVLALMEEEETEDRIYQALIAKCVIGLNPEEEEEAETPVPFSKSDEKRNE